MVRISLSLIISSFVLTGCQQTKMSSTAPKTSASVQAPAPAAQPVYPPQQPVYPQPPVAPQPPIVEQPPVYPPVNPPVTTPDPRNPQVEPRDPTPVVPVTPRYPEDEPRVNTNPPYFPPLTPTRDIPVVPPSNPPPVDPPTPVFQPPSITETTPPPTWTQPTPVPNPGSDPVVPTTPPVTTVPPTVGIPQVPVDQGSPFIPQTPVAGPNNGQPVTAPLPPVRPQGLTGQPNAAVSVPRQVQAPQPPSRPADLTVAQPEPKLVQAPIPTPRPADLALAPKKEPMDGQCGPLKLEATEKNEKLDVLFVVDTSASLRGGTVKGKKGELEQIASQMEAFVNNFPEKTDINIAVMLGHGTGSWTGRLFKSSPGEAAVLKRSEIRNSADLIRRLETKMKNVPNESLGAQGEALLYSLYESAARNKNLNEIRQQGFYRKDAKLAVIMVSDEQDVCFDYDDPRNFDPETGAAYVANGKKDKKGKSVRDPVEVKFFENVCKKAYGGKELLRPGHVHKALSSLVGGNENLILMGMIYNTKTITPIGTVTNAKEDENEMGHGIKEFVTMERGLVADLAKVQEGPAKFQAELRSLGDYTKAELNSNGNVSCDPMTQGDPAINPLEVDLKTLKLQVMNAQGQVIGVFGADCKNASCGEGRGGLTADIRMVGNRRVIQAFMEAKALNKILNAHQLKESRVLFTYRTLGDAAPEAEDEAAKPVRKATIRRR